MAAAAAAAVALPVVWWAPLNVDEQVTLTIAPRSVGEIFDIVWGRRGGGPVHFLLEHVLLAWPGGVVGLRVPSLVFFLLTLPAAALLARELAGTLAAHFVVVMLAVAPLAASLATFGRPHTLLLAGVTWGTWAAVRAGRLGGRRRWLVAAVVLAALVYVHPTAPLYAGVAVIASLLAARLPLRRIIADAVPAAIAFLAITTPYLMHTLGVVEARYGVGEGRSGRTFTGTSVYDTAMGALAPGPTPIGLISLLAAGGFVVVAARSRRTALALAVLVLAPIAFWTYVPTSASSGVFFGRYMLPALPAFLVLVAASLVAVMRLPGGRVAAALLLTAVVAIEVRVDVSRHLSVERLGVVEVGDAVASIPDALLFGSSGTIGERGTISALTRGRPPTLVDRYVTLRHDSVDAVDDGECDRVAPFLRRPGTHVGVWLFYKAPPADPSGVEQRFEGIRGVTARTVASRYVLVRSDRALPPRRLIRLGALTRSEWLALEPEDVAAADLLATDRRALRGAC